MAEKMSHVNLFTGERRFLFDSGRQVLLVVAKQVAQRAYRWSFWLLDYLSIRQDEQTGFGIVWYLQTPSFDVLDRVEHTDLGRFRLTPVLCRQGAL